MGDVMINELIDIMEKEFDLFCSIDFSSDNSNNILEIEGLCLEEEKYIDFLPRNINFLDNLSLMVHNFYKGDFSLKRYFVLLRFDNVLESLKASIENNYLDVDEMKLDEFYDGYYAYNFARVKFLTNFVKNNKEFIYLAVFSNKEISDCLISKNFDLESLDYNSSDLINEKNTDFLDFYDEFLYLEAQNVVALLLGSSEFEMSNIIFEYNLTLFKDLLMSMSEDNFNLLRKDLSNNSFYSNNDIFNDLNSVFDDIFKKRFSYNYNSSVSTVDINLFDSLVNLIKLEETILNNYEILDLSNEESVKNFLNLISFESDIISSFNIDEYDADSLSDIVDNDILFFIFNEQYRDLISKRIKNLLPTFKNKNNSFIGKSCDLIIRNHVINSLDEYKNVICNIPSNENANEYINVYKRVIFEYPDLLNDILTMNFDFSILFSLDDFMSTKLLGLKNIIDFSYDKDDYLYNIGLSLIDTINDLSKNVDLIALYEFKICEFNDIINNVSDEHLYSLLDKIQCLDSSRVKRKLLKNFDFNYKH